MEEWCMKRNIIPFLIILSLSTCFLFPMVVDSRYYDYETLLNDDVLSKCDNYLVSELSQEGDNQFFDVIIGCNPNAPSDYAEVSAGLVDNLVVTKNWNKFFIFRSNLTKTHLDSSLNTLAYSTTGNDRYVGYTSTYSGVYYIRVCGQDHTGDYYDISILTTPS